MKIIKTKISGLLIVKSKIYSDNRGFFKEVESSKILKKKFVFDCFSYSKKNTLRGLHFQKIKSQAKLITVVHGKILDVVVDLRRNLRFFLLYQRSIIWRSDYTSRYHHLNRLLYTHIQRNHIFFWHK